MNPALLATLGTLAETASLKADILPPVSGENAPVFTLPKMVVAAVAERVHSAKTSQQQATRPQENDPVAMQALMALLLPQPAAPHQDTPQPRKRRNIAGYPAIDESGGAKRAATPDAAAGTHVVAAAVAGTDRSVAAGETRTAGQTGDLRQ